jgi:hypothetical protein
LYSFVSFMNKNLSLQLNIAVTYVAGWAEMTSPNVWQANSITVSPDQKVNKAEELTYLSMYLVLTPKNQTLLKIIISKIFYCQIMSLVDKIGTFYSE